MGTELWVAGSTKARTDRQKDGWIMAVQTSALFIGVPSSTEYTEVIGAK